MKYFHPIDSHSNDATNLDFRSEGMEKTHSSLEHETTSDTSLSQDERVVHDAEKNDPEEKNDPATTTTTTVIRDDIPLTNLALGLIGWDSQDDPSMPLNFVPRKKWLLIFLLAFLEFITPLASSMFAPALLHMQADFHNTSAILGPMVVTIFLLGFVIGPLVLAPLGEIYGRRPVLAASNIIFVAFQIGCALAPNIGALVAFRFLAGIGGSGCLAVGGGVIADLFRQSERGMATALYSLGPVIGPTGKLFQQICFPIYSSHLVSPLFPIFSTRSVSHLISSSRLIRCIC